MAGLPKKTLIFSGVLLAANLGGAYLLDALGLVEGLLSPNGAEMAYLLPLAVVFYLARIGALFLAPGLVLGATVVWLVRRGAGS